MRFDHNGIVPFLTGVAIYASILLIPLWRIGRVRWQKVQEKLKGWSGYEVALQDSDAGLQKMLDEGGWGQIGEHLKTLGFEKFHEYVRFCRVRFSAEVAKEHAPLATPLPIEIQQHVQLVEAAVIRVWRHEQHNCLAFVCVTRSSETQKIEHFLKIMSAGQGWSYTSVLGPTPGVDVGRSGRRLVTFCGALAHQQVSAELLEKHLVRRALIAQIGGFAWQAPLSSEEVSRGEEEYAADVREFGKRHSPLSYLIWNWRAERKYSSEWFGELSGKLPSP